ncbi:MAG TPA: hypothetical protein VLA05_05890 [Coriobacteriia bacterium]|nr:hypothetical protein [Coriobacteriia bacterium]
MFDDDRGGSLDRLTVVLNDMEEWLEDNGYEVSEALRTGSFHWSEPGYAVAIEHDAITIGYLEEEGGEPVMRTYVLEELWEMDEEEFREELEDLTTEV